MLSNISILVVDDEAELRDLVVSALSKKGAAAVGAASGNEAWLLLQREKFDVVLSDVWMPNGDGIDLIKKIKELLPVKPLVFIYSGYPTVAHEEADKYNVVEVFFKPFDFQSITESIANAVSMTRQHSVQ